jgi:hypothetical protein
MEMARVIKCDAIECDYNREKACHAIAITVGHGNAHPRCDTMFESGTHGGVPKIIAGVGACKVAGCKFNQSLECTAKGITVGHHSDEVDCLTFQAV